MYIKVKDTPDLVRDNNNNALLNTSVESLDAYKKRKNSYLNVSKINEEINDLKNEFQEIKQMLTFLINGKS